MDSIIPILAAIGLIGVFAVVLMVVPRMTRAHFEKKFPPISDDEFLARCTPGTSAEVALKVRRIIADHLAVSYERIHPSMSFIEDIGAD